MSVLKQSIFILAISFSFGFLFAQTESLVKVGEYKFPTAPTNCSGIWPPEFGTSDLWGYTDEEGNDYALVGTNKGFSVLSVPELELLAEVQAPQMNPANCRYFPRDIKTIGHYAYMTTDGQEGANSGIMIFDLSGLPNSVRLVKAYRPGAANLVTSHNMSIDVANKYAYACLGGFNGFRIINIADPENPVEGVSVTTGTIHDITAFDNLVYVAGGSNWFSIWDVSNKSAPKQLTKFSSAVTYSHTIWPTDDRNYVITTDETANKDVLFWDVDKTNNYANPKIVGRWLGQSKMGHNLIIKGKYAFMSHYASGVYVLDISNMANPTVVAHVDTHKSSNPALDEQPGLWGAFGIYITENNHVISCNMDDGVVTVMKWSDGTTGIQNKSGKFSNRHIGNLYPNPVQTNAYLPFFMERDGLVETKIRDSRGVLVGEIAETSYSQGTQILSIGPNQFRSGLAEGRYYITLKVNGNANKILSTSFDYIGD